MYDQTTKKLIASAASFEGLSLAELPKKLTRAYAELMAAGARLSQGEAGPNTGMQREIRLFNRLGRAYGTLACLLESTNPQKTGCAFVAATAHELLAKTTSKLLHRSSDGDTVARSPHLSANAVSADACATALFLIAGAIPDAQEAARRLPTQAHTSAEAVIAALAHIAQGAPQKVLELPPVTPTALEDNWPEEEAAELLFNRLLGGLRTLANELLGSSTPLEETSKAQFISIRDDSYAKLSWSNTLDLQFDSVSPGSGPTAVSAFGGVFHLANLLQAVSSTLVERALIAVPAPTGIPANSWAQVLTHLARSRPVLWPNHADAISKGFLEPGRSSAISFPTGAGKTTVVNLKIASTLLKGADVIFLAPTHALVDQVWNELKSSFPNFRVVPKLRMELEGEPAVDFVSTVSVVTPERCLAALSANAQGFSRVGLLVLDECHLMHPTRGTSDQRSLDAMLCILNMASASPNADFALMSAMMANAREIADWIGELTGRPCIHLDMDWKPTRQARGCLVYDLSTVDALSKRLAETSVNDTRKVPPQNVKESLKAHPYGLFCLQHSWTNETDDYVLTSLLSEEVTLGAAERIPPSNVWRLTANRNQVSARIAAGLAKAKIKTLVLVQNPDWVGSLANELVRRVGQRPLMLDATDQELLETAILEMGGRQHVDVLDSRDVAVHHGSLLPPERRLAERLFMRDDGCSALVVSPTMSMGVNLPAEAVVIAGDDKFDRETEKFTQLSPHELLNAAGRAGRAGLRAQGMVIVVPSHVVGFDEAESKITRHWRELQAAFSASDQCIEITDPVSTWLGAIAAQAPDGVDEPGQYLLARLPSGESAASSAFLLRTLGASRARRAGQAALADYEKMVQHALAIRAARTETVEADWMQSVASNNGLPSRLIQDVTNFLRGFTDPTALSIQEWIGNWFGWLAQAPDRTGWLFGHNTVDTLVRQVLPREARTQPASTWLPKVSTLLDLWVRGQPLNDLELHLGTPPKSLKTCKRARVFAIRVVPGIAHGMSLITTALREGVPTPADGAGPASLVMLGQCIREGFTRPELLALQRASDDKLSRVQAHTLWSQIQNGWASESPITSFPEMLRRARELL